MITSTRPQITEDTELLSREVEVESLEACAPKTEHDNNWAIQQVAFDYAGEWERE